MTTHIIVFLLAFSVFIFIRQGHESRARLLKEHTDVSTACTSASTATCVASVLKDEKIQICHEAYMKSDSYSEL